MKERLFQGTSYSETTTAAGPGENIGTVGICPNQFLAEIGYELFGIALMPKDQLFGNSWEKFDSCLNQLQNCSNGPVQQCAHANINSLVGEKSYQKSKE